MKCIAFHNSFLYFRGAKAIEFMCNCCIVRCFGGLNTQATQNAGVYDLAQVYFACAYLLDHCSTQLVVEWAGRPGAEVQHGGEPGHNEGEHEGIPELQPTTQRSNHGSRTPVPAGGQ